MAACCFRPLALLPVAVTCAGNLTHTAAHGLSALVSGSAIMCQTYVFIDPCKPVLSELR